METSFFKDKLEKPTDDMVAGVLGSATSNWNNLRERIAARINPLSEEWTFSGKNYGWTLRLKQKKRAVLYMTPLKGYFRVSFAMGDKAARTAQKADIPRPVLEIIEKATRFPEGRAVRMEIRKKTDLPVVEKLAAIKMIK
jgi:hypothetical protein